MRRLAALSFSFSAAVLACNYVLPQGRWLWAAAVSLVLLGGSFLLLKGRRRKLLCLVCAGLSAGFLWTQFYDAVFFQPARELDDQTIRMNAVVTDYPRERDYGWQVSARMETENGRNLNVLLYLDEQGEFLRPGDRIEAVAHCTLGTLSSAGEEITYYTAKGIFLWGKCYGTLNIARPDSIPLRFWPAHLAHLLKGGIDTAFPKDVSGIVRAVVTGSRDKLTDEFTSSLERTGLSHTVAVSGMHLSCFAAMLAFLLGRGKRSTACLVIMWAVVFSAVAGSTPSVSRAAVMIVLLQLAPLLRRERDDVTALGVALMLLLLWNPYSAAHVGLQLSFAAVAGIFLLAGPMQQWALEKMGLLKRVKGKTLRIIQNVGCGVVGVLCTTLGAMAATIPLTAIHFGTLSLIAPVSNLLTIWAVTGLFALGIVVGLLCLLVPGLAQVLSVPVSWLARYVDGCSGFFSEFTYSALSLDSVFYRIWLMLAYAVLLPLIFQRGKRRFIVPVCCVVVTLCLSITLTALEFQRGGLRVTALDVGQGQSVLLRCGNTLMLVDCGGDAPENAGDVAADYLQGRGKSKLDFLVLTHCHDDHANGVLQLLNRVAVDNLVLPVEQGEEPLRQEILELAAEQNIPVHIVRYDTVVDLGQAAQIALYPPMAGGGEVNELGLTVLATAGEFNALITGDTGAETERRLLSYADLPDVELLIAGHHGSDHSTTQELLDKITPEICFISVGAHNRYGHPGEDALRRLTAAGAEVFRTDENGTITLNLN